MNEVLTNARQRLRVDVVIVVVLLASLFASLFGGWHYIYEPERLRIEEINAVLVLCDRIRGETGVVSISRLKNHTLSYTVAKHSYLFNRFYIADECGPRDESRVAVLLCSRIDKNRFYPITYGGDRLRNEDMTNCITRNRLIEVQLIAHGKHNRR